MLLPDDSALLHGQVYDLEAAREYYRSKKVPDDSALLHGADYDPAKAREYYLRTRKLKGRHPGAGNTPSGSGGHGAAPAGSRPHGGGESATVKAQKEALQARLSTLKEHLSGLVAAAKMRSGIDPKTEAAAKKAASDKKAGKKLTPKEKREAAKASEKYRKENENPSLKALVSQIQDVQKQIQAALEAARKTASSKTPSKTVAKSR